LKHLLDRVRKLMFLRVFDLSRTPKNNNIVQERNSDEETENK